MRCCLLKGWTDGPQETILVYTCYIYLCQFLFLYQHPTTPGNTNSSHITARRDNDRPGRERPATTRFHPPGFARQPVAEAFVG